MSTNPTPQRAPKEAPAPIQTPTSPSHPIPAPRNSPPPPNLLVTEDPTSIAIQIYHSSSISELNRLLEELDPHFHGEGGLFLRQALDDIRVDWTNLAYAAETFTAATQRCISCKHVHQEETKVRLGQALFEAQFSALKRANAKGKGLGESKMPGIEKWIEVLEGVVETYKTCPEKDRGN